MDERLEKQIRFLKEIDREKLIGRQTYLADGSRMENDAEHAWHLALCALILNEYANEEIDLLKTMSMVLIHDLIEIVAGDTYAYDEEAKTSQHERELAGADYIYGLLPEDQGQTLRSLWEEFEKGETPESRFARMLDNIQPTMLNDASNGRSWSTRDVQLSWILNRNRYTKDGSQVLWDYSYQNWIMKHVKEGHIIDDREDETAK